MIGMVGTHKNECGHRSCGGICYRYMKHMGSQDKVIKQLIEDVKVREENLLREKLVKSKWHVLYKSLKNDQEQIGYINDNK